MDKKVVYKYSQVFSSVNDVDYLTYEKGDVKLFFSSNNNVKMFNKKINDTIKRIKHWKGVFNIDFLDLYLIELLYTYELVEKRGFRIMIKEVEYKCPKEVKENIRLMFFKK